MKAASKKKPGFFPSLVSRGDGAQTKPGAPPPLYLTWAKEVGCCGVRELSLPPKKRHEVLSFLKQAKMVLLLFFVISSKSEKDEDEALGSKRAS